MVKFPKIKTSWLDAVKQYPIWTLPPWKTHLEEKGRFPLCHFLIVASGQKIIYLTEMNPQASHSMMKSWQKFAYQTHEEAPIMS